MKRSVFMVQQLAVPHGWLHTHHDGSYEWLARESDATAFSSAADALRTVLSFALETHVHVFEASVREVPLTELGKIAGRFPEYGPCHCRATRIMDDEADVTDEFGKRHTIKKCER